MAIVRRIQKIGNSRGIILSSDMIEHLGANETGQVELWMEAGSIVVTGIPALANGNRSANLKLRPGPNWQTFDEALRSTLTEYGPALPRLAGGPIDNRANGTSQD